MKTQTVTPNPAALESLAAELANSLHADAVFLSPGSYPESVITVILNSAAADTELTDFRAHALASSYPIDAIRMFDSDYAKRALADSNLYFISHVAYGQMLFSEPGSEWQHLADTRSADRIAGARQHFSKALRLIGKLNDDAQKAADEDKFVEAAMLQHMAMTETYRTAASFLLGKGSPSQSIADQLQTIAEVAPGLWSLTFDDDIMDLLKSLDGFYLDGATNRSLQVSEPQFRSLQQKSGALTDATTVLFEECIGHVTTGTKASAVQVIPAKSPAPVLVPEGTSQPDSLEKIVSELASLLSPDFIMMHTAFDDGRTYQMLTVIVEGDYNDVEPTNRESTSIVAWYSAFRHRIFKRDYAMAQLNNGSFYFMNSLLFGTLVYANPEASELETKHLIPAELLLKAVGQYNDMAENVKGLREGAVFYAGQANYTQATFALAQSAQLLYKWAERCVKGHEEKVRRYYDHQGGMRGFINAIAGLFEIRQMEERAFMRLLDDVHKEQQGGSTVVTKEQYEIFATKVTKLEQGVKAVFQATKRSLSDRIHRPTGMEQRSGVARNAVGSTAEPMAFHVSEIEEVVGIITKYIKTDSIYCFGKRSRTHTHSSAVGAADRNSTTVHYDLLVVSTDTRQNLIADCSDIVRKSTNGRFTVTLLIHKPTQILYTLKRQQHFFWHILNRGVHVFQDPEAPEIEMKVCPPRDIEASRRYWWRRDQIADMFLEGSTADISDEGQGQMAMLTLVAEHVCLGLIEVFLGYRPTHFAMGYLFDLCESFCTLPSDIFPRESAEDRKHFKMLSTGLSNLRKPEFKEYRYMATDTIESRVSAFYKQSVILIENELDRISNFQKGVNE